MRKKRANLQKQAWKNGNEARFEQMVSEYHKEKAVLEAMTAGSEEYDQQKKLCEKLFANAERFFKQHQ
ncbi:hypothetical protein RN22_10245 [Grimontia sp. AD028]|uniref:Uncharacterized protein n=1 Tax=Grimontia indica TaxID=1056512 RepID=R1IQU5_9GAMM|nr:MULTISPECIES: hypothetical protein [Grimontia]EOD79842.1 hypothetical protein D515_00975 [Grimontia indica]KKD60557.1 hypothetical protein RN22_10245 [Grimontia sp. AD028]